MNDELRASLAVDAATAAQRLLGWTLSVHERVDVGTTGGAKNKLVVAGVVVETEAYEGEDDPASHAANGPTPRNRAMYERAGVLYVYRSYGIHWCANVVCGQPGTAAAVLIRALEPSSGEDEMWHRRPKARAVRDLCSGPGKLCAALGISEDHYGLDLLASDSTVRLSPPVMPVGPVSVGRRIGISKAVERPLRFGVANSGHLSKPFS